MTSRIGKGSAIVALSAAMISGLCVFNVCIVQVQAKTAAAVASSAVNSTSESWVVALKNLKNAATRVSKATADVINDVGQRKAVADIDDAVFFQPSNRQIDKNAALWSKRQSQLGPLETPRKSWLDSDMANLKRWVEVLNTDVDATPSASNPNAQAQWTEMNAIVKDLNKHFATLEGLTAGPTYDNLAIASAAFAVRDDVNRLEKPWKAATKVSGK